MTEQRVSVPNIGDASDVAVVEVLVQPGARVEKEQALVVLESDKASMEIPSPMAGVVKSITVKVGDAVSEGSPLLVIETDGAGEATPAPEPAAAKAPKAEAEAAPAPEPAAAKAAKAETPAAKPSEKAQPPAGSPPAQAASPQPQPAAARERGSEEVESQTRTFPPAAEPPPPSQAEQGRGLPHASPAIRRFARELGVELARIEGSGKHGRITKEDLQRHVKQALTGGAGAGVGLSIAEAPEIDFTKFGPIEQLALTKIQRLTGKNLHRSWVTIPHVTQFDDADITELEAFRKKLKADQPKLKLTLLCFFMKAVVSALKAMPRFNSSLDKSGHNLILKGYYHIGVAVDTPNGLVVPAIRDVDQKSLSQLAKELEEVSERARTRKLMPNDLQGASFTISSLGGIGGTKFTPIINPPEVAVLGVSRAQIRPLYEGGAFVPRLICPVSLSYDHRVIDGADAARFTKRLCELLSDIRQLLL